MFQKTISKEELSELPFTQFGGDIHLIEKEEELEFAINYLQKQELIGFDTETRPSFKKGKINKVALLQLSGDDKAFIFRLNKLGLPDRIAGLLSDASKKKVGVAIRDDIKILRKLTAFEPAGFLELQEYVKEFGIENFSLKKLAGIVLGVRISKSQRLTNWEAEILTPAQLSYAATDAWISAEIYRALQTSGN